MNVLHLAPGNLYGGVETLLVTLARHRHLCPDMVPSFGLCVEGRLAEELRAARVAVHLLAAVRASRPWTVPLARYRLRQLLRQGRYDAVICHMAWTQAVFGPAVRSCGVPLVFWLHGPTDGRHWTERWARFTQPRQVIAVSRHTATTAPALYPGVPAEVCYTPLPPPANGAPREAVRKALGAPEDAVVILQASRLDAWKGHRHHLAALGRLADLPGWVGWIAGGPQRPAEQTYLAELQGRAAELGLEGRVRFLGQRQDVPDLLQAADVYCQPNTASEGFSLVFLEACLARLPIVTTDLGSAREIVDDQTGRLIPAGATERLAGALAELVKDAALRRRLGAAGERRARHLCDPARQLQQLHALLGG
jgi:glycosyltransferase involved in cell wall biosynthesis